MTSVDRPGAATIATGEPRVVAIFSTLAACAIAGSWVHDGPPWLGHRSWVHDEPPWLRHAPRGAVVTYLAIVAVACIWGCFRGWRLGLRIDDNGMTIRNFFRTHRFTWPEVSRFADGTAFNGESRDWALRVVLHNGKAVTARGTTRSGPRTPRRWPRSGRPLSAIRYRPR